LSPTFLEHEATKGEKEGGENHIRETKNVTLAFLSNWMRDQSRGRGPLGEERGYRVSREGELPSRLRRGIERGSGKTGEE